VAWVGFAAGLGLFALAWSSVVKTLAGPGEHAIAHVERLERVLAMGPPVFLVVLLGCCLYVAYALIRPEKS